MPLRAWVLTYAIISAMQNEIISKTFITKAQVFTSTLLPPSGFLHASFLAFYFISLPPSIFQNIFFFLLFIILHSFQAEVCKMSVIFTEQYV